MSYFSNSRCAAHLLAVVAGLACSPSLLAQPLQFAGRWIPDDHLTAPADYAMLTIENGRLSWGGLTKSPPTCVRQFVLQQEQPGTMYADGRGTKFIAGVAGSLPTFLLKIGASTCRGVEDAVRISFPLAYDRDRMELIDYAKGKPIATRRFHRKK